MTKAVGGSEAKPRGSGAGRRLLATVAKFARIASSGGVELLKDKPSDEDDRAHDEDDTARTESDPTPPD